MISFSSFSEASDTVRLSHSGGGCKYADAPDVYEILQPVQEAPQVGWHRHGIKRSVSEPHKLWAEEPFWALVKQASGYFEGEDPSIDTSRDALLGYNNYYLRSKNDVDLSPVEGLFRPSTAEQPQEICMTSVIWSIRIPLVGRKTCSGNARYFMRRFRQRRLIGHLILWQLIN